ncbi:multidrug MFS transporter [Lactobacillus sp. CBA3605]|uniref:glycosyltransferase n=1 Tax=Lactobacillus sp. CBA3605 TaxID=2099788 RepID=UPI000CFBD365|nr:glycosyltransferase [Lactobacillus sp. CBA3605]AVK62239.1 multidrug MFS transporter [Lactobacillus sp. CBA3605]
MIFVTVGTHEQPFNRLIKKIDELKTTKTINEDVTIQTGYSTYIPKSCISSKFYPYQKMETLVRNADIVITHGGPSSFVMPLQYGKIPIVVPRLAKYHEHVNDHQLDFAREIEQRIGNIIVVEDIEELGDVIINYREISQMKTGKINNHNDVFNRKLTKLVAEMFEEQR